MEKRTLFVNDVVQVDPAYDIRFGGCFMIVSEPKPWGAQGYIHIPGQGNAYYRCAFANMEFIGHAVFALPTDKEES